MLCSWLPWELPEALIPEPEGKEEKSEKSKPGNLHFRQEPRAAATPSACSKPFRTAGAAGCVHPAQGPSPRPVLEVTPKMVVAPGRTVLPAPSSGC